MLQNLWIPELGVIVISVVGGALILLLIAAVVLMRWAPEDGR